MIIVIANHKGGVAKSQTALELAFFLMSQGCKVLLMDIDPQANASDILLMGNKPSGRTLPEILIDGDVIRSNDIMTRTFGLDRNLDYVCSSLLAARIETRINASPKEYVVGDALGEVKNQYDFIIVDTPPAAELLGLSAMIAADEVLIPVTPDKPSIDGVESVIRTVKAISRNPRLNPNLKVKGILVTRFRATNSAVQGVMALGEAYGNLVVEPQVRECTRVQQAVAACRPVLDYDPSCSAARDYVSVFKTM